MGLTPVLLVIATLTFVVGSVVALSQPDIKRMLAYSSIAHAGFLLLGVASVSRAGLSASMFYLAAYGFATLGAFAIVVAGARRRRGGDEAVPVGGPGPSEPDGRRRRSRCSCWRSPESR